MSNELGALTLRDLRVRQELSQAEVAQRIGVCQPTLHYWERGKVGVSAKHRHQLAAIYSCTAADVSAAIINTRKEKG